MSTMSKALRQKSTRQVDMLSFIESTFSELQGMLNWIHVSEEKRRNSLVAVLLKAHEEMNVQAHIIVGLM